MHTINSLSTEFSTSPLLKEIQEEFGNIPFIFKERKGWRMRAKLAVRGTMSSPKIGLFLPGTHQVVDLLHCEDHHPSINKALSFLKISIMKNEILPYDEQSLLGDLRYLQLTTEKSTETVQLVLIINGKQSLPKIKKWIEQLKCDFNWHSIWINIQEGSTNVIFGPTWIHCHGPKTCQQTLQGRTYHFHPACFMQANLSVYDLILQDIKEQILPEKNVIEYYAGIGTIGLTIAPISKSLTCVEINPYSEACFDPTSNATYITGSTKEQTHQMKDHQVLIVDPPRKGLEPCLLEELPSSIEQILYLSCHFPTLKRDLEILKKKGWSVKTAKSYWLFPNTNHVEILVSLEKSG